MDTLNNIAYNIAEAADKAEDFSVVERIKKLIIYYRALFIRRSVEKNNFLSSHFKQSITTKTAKVKDYNHGGTSIRTIIEIPKTIRLKHNESFTYVGGIDGITPFNEITQRQSGLLKYSITCDIANTPPNTHNIPTSSNCNFLCFLKTI